MASFCTNCGAQLSENQSFCTSCGAKIENNQTYSASMGQQPYASSTNTNNQQYYDGAVNASVGMTPTQMVKKAWEDIKATKGWTGKLFLWALVALIPVLNFFVLGALLKSGRDASLHGEKAFEGLFNEGNFLLGFFSFVVSLVWGIVVGLVSSIPVLGLVVAVFALPLQTLCLMRLGLFGKLGNAFEFTTIWETYKKSVGNILVVYWLPTVILMAVGIVVDILIALVGGVSILGVVGAVGYASAPLAGLSVVTILIVLVLLYVLFVCAIVLEIITFRAFGYYIAETSRSWVNESVTVNPRVY
jgi:hypothetical protein